MAQRLHSPQATGGASTDATTGLAPVLVDFWNNQLRRTPDTGACPMCGKGDLEVRETRHRGRLWRYVLHCGCPQIAEWPGPG